MEQSIRRFGRRTETMEVALKTLAADFWQRICRLAELSRQRRQLKNLDARLLDDIGIDRAQALKEANRPLWDI